MLIKHISQKLNNPSQKFSSNKKIIMNVLIFYVDASSKIPNMAQTAKKINNS